MAALNGRNTQLPPYQLSVCSKLERWGVRPGAVRELHSTARLPGGIMWHCIVCTVAPHIGYSNVGGNFHVLFTPLCSSLTAPHQQGVWGVGSVNK